MNDPDINEAFRRLARGERFAPSVPTRDEAAAILNDDPAPQAHGSADGGGGQSRPAPNATNDINELFRELLRG